MWRLRRPRRDVVRVSVRDDLEHAVGECGHPFTHKDGTVVTTTWHDTRRDALFRIATPKTATFRKVFHEKHNILGAYRAVTWS